MDVISGKLRTAIEAGDKRIEIKILRRKTKWHNVRESRLIAGMQN